jgi:hypothetical protein
MWLQDVLRFFPRILTLDGWQDDEEEEKEYEGIKTIYTPINAIY